MAKHYIWKKDEEMHRLHPSRYGAVQFNPSTIGNARFSPIQRADGTPIPTIYGGKTFDCAALETVFHDVPFAPGLKIVDKARMVDWTHSIVTPDQDLRLLDLSTPSLRALGIQRNKLIDTEKSEYPFTRQWAMDAYEKYPDIQGLCWVSRQDDRARAVVLFGDRIAPSTLKHISSRVILGGAAYVELLVLAEVIGVLIVDGRT